MIAGVGLGSNLGDRASMLSRAVRSLAAVPGVRVAAVSLVYETPAVGPSQPDYLNAAVRVETSMEPESLMRVLLEVEASLGRVRGERWGPRTIDLDVLALWDDDVGQPMAHDTELLRAPHPFLEARAFALAPLLEVLPEVRASLAPVLEALGGPPALASPQPSIVLPLQRG